MRKLILALVVVGMCWGMTGCATISSGSDTYTQFNSTPEKIECTVEGQNYKQVITTPANLTLPAKAAPVTITCNTQGYHQGVRTIDTKMDGSIFGNILLGGGVGLIIDAWTKSGQKYPKSVMMELDKKEFATPEERDKWYDDAKAAVKEKTNREIQVIIAGCKEDDKMMCERKVKKLNAALDERLAVLTNHHEQAVILKPAPILSAAQQADIPSSARVVKK